MEVHLMLSEKAKHLLDSFSAFDHPNSVKAFINRAIKNKTITDQESLEIWSQWQRIRVKTYRQYR